MKIETDLYTLIEEKIKDYKGYIVFEIKDDDHRTNIWHFENKEEFEKNFELRKHSLYPGDHVFPINIIKEYGRYIDCTIDGNIEYLNTGSLYLEIKE